MNRIDPDLPFYFWTSSDRFHLEEEPSFDEISIVQNGERTLTRLHKIRRRSRTDSSIISAGRAVMPNRHKRSLRQSLYAFSVDLPPIPEEMHEHIRRVIADESTPASGTQDSSSTPSSL